MFYRKLEKLCAMQGVSMSKVAKDLGLSTGLQTGWKNGAMPRRSTVKKIADYFQVPVSYFEEEAFAVPDEAGKVVSDRTVSEAQKAKETQPQNLPPQVTAAAAHIDFSKPGAIEAYEKAIALVVATFGKKE